jgi:hypothetical protein
VQPVNESNYDVRKRWKAVVYNKRKRSVIILQILSEFLYTKKKKRA